MMRRFLSCMAILAISSIVGASVPFGRRGHEVALQSFFGVRGGGLFNKGEKTETATKKYPAMSQDEVEEWLAHIPVFAVTDSKGSGVVLKPDNTSSVFYFFMSPQMANATLTQLKGTNEELDLRVSAFSLGKIWYKILNSNKDLEVKLQDPLDPTGEGTVATGVEYRLVPDTRDLLGARMLLTMDPEDGEALKQGGSLTPEMAQAAIKKAMEESPKFKSTYNEIPVFMIQQMRMQKQPAEGASTEEEPVTLLPMYFNLQNMVALWQQFTAQSAEAKGVEPAINLMDLHELVKMMQAESEIDFRNVVLVPPTPMGMGPDGQPMNVAAPQSAQPPSGGDEPFKMPGDTTLGDL